MEKSRKPKIRFKGFTDDWEQRKLGEIAKTTIGEFVIKTKQDDNYPYPVFNGGSSNTGFYNEFNNEGNKILVSARGANAGFVNIVKTRYWAGNSCYSIDLLDKNEFDTDFIFQEMKRNQERFTENQQAANIPSVSKADVEKFVVDVPSYAEQLKIGEYFANLDNLITLHQRKLDKLVNVKKSMLEKMFPKQGSKVPNIRFAGFADDWEQREFSEIFDCTISNNTLSRSELSYEEGSILNIHYGDILIKYGSILDIHKYKIPRIPNEKKEDFRGSLLQPGDIVIADTAEDETTGKACEIGSLFGNSIVAGLHTMVARPNIEMASGYLGYYLNSNAYHCQLLPMMQGIKVLSLSRANVKKTALKFPESIKEQQLIANYFIQLDELITLHQRKLEKLKNIKKSMLDKMFI